MNMRKNSDKVLRVGIALDESSSMSSVIKETIQGINEQLDELKVGKVKKGINTYVTMVTFSGHDDLNVRFHDTPIDEMPKIDITHYDPCGLTAMYDGVGKTIGLLKAQEDTEETTFMLVVITDGAENNSREFNAQDIANMIKECEDTKKWTISYMGANQDLKEVSNTLGIKQSNMAMYSSSAEGTMSAFSKLRKSTENYITARALVSGDELKLGNLSKNFYSESDEINVISESNSSTGDPTANKPYTTSNNND